MLTPPPSPSRSLQVKICGLTRPDEAAACARLGADAIGLVFYPKSPRHVSDDQGRAIVAALPSSLAAVGVFVDADFEAIMARVSGCGLSMAQLHGQETPMLTERLKAEGVGVIKALFVGGRPDLEEARNYNTDAFLVECAKGPLPGGNAMTWDWAAARDFGRQHPLILAGGLNSDNVAEAVLAARPAAIDLSSGVEASAGRKDPDKVARLLDAVNRIAAPDDSFRSSRVFRPRKG